MSKKTLSIMQMVKNVFQYGYIDDHTDREETCQFVGILTQPYKGKMYVVPLFAHCNLNPFYYDENDGRVHLSTCSVSGGFEFGPEGKVDEAVRQWNRRREYVMNVDDYYPFESLMLITKMDWSRKNG